MHFVYSTEEDKLLNGHYYRHDEVEIDKYTGCPASKIKEWMDSLFEFINSEEVGNIVKSYYEKNDIVGCCEYLYKESYRKWLCEEEDTVDDITIILVFFEDN